MKSASKRGYSLKGRKILITGGPTWIPIDGVRVISNISSGKLSQELALRLTAEKADVVLLEGPVQEHLSSKEMRIIPFTFFDELKTALNKELKKKYDVIIHAAAVSDYKIKRPLKNKLSSSLKSLCLELVPTEKLINGIKKISPDSLLIGFKLEPNIKMPAVLEKTRGLFETAKCDLVIANCINKGHYKGLLLSDKGNILSTANSRNAMVSALIQNLKTCMAHSKKI